jgi:hypothetical protein
MLQCGALQFLRPYASAHLTREPDVTSLRGAWTPMGQLDQV